MLSVVIPIHNEERAILRLYDRLTEVLGKLGQRYEIIFVDDASSDRSFDLLANLVETDKRLKVIRLRRNFGQTAALAAGFDEARGEIIVAMDGDLQHDPADLPALVHKLEEGYDHFFMNACDGSDGRMSARWGQQGEKKGTLSSGLN